MPLVVITGGMRSGKSRASQRLAFSLLADGQAVTVAVFARVGSDPELADRVARHKTLRPQGFATLEATDSAEWFERVPAESVLVVDCLGTLLGRIMEECWVRTVGGDLAEAGSSTLPAGFAALVHDEFSARLDRLLARPGNTIVVTNEVGSSVVPEWASARLFADELGDANKRLVGDADSAYLAVCGRLISLAELPVDACWPEDV